MDKKELLEEIIKLVPENYLKWKQETGMVAGNMMGQAEVDSFIEYLKKKLENYEM